LATQGGTEQRNALPAGPGLAQAEVCAWASRILQLS
jgi:hypothetical protein